MPVAKALSVIPKLMRQCQKEAETKIPPWQSWQLKQEEFLVVGEPEKPASVASVWI